MVNEVQVQMCDVNVMVLHIMVNVMVFVRCGASLRSGKLGNMLNSMSLLEARLKSAYKHLRDAG